MRARLQVLVQHSADKTAPPEFTVNQPLSSCSWKMEEDIFVPNHRCADIAPKSLLQLVACGCKSASHCSQSRSPDQLNGAPQQQNDKSTIKNLPLSVSNEEIKNMLEGRGISLVSPVKYGFIRKDDGDLIAYKSGDRFVYT